MKQEESTTQAKLRLAETYHNHIVSNKDGQIQTLRDQMQHLSGSESREDCSRSERRGYEASGYQRGENATELC